MRTVEFDLDAFEKYLLKKAAAYRIGPVTEEKKGASKAVLLVHTEYARLRSQIPHLNATSFNSVAFQKYMMKLLNVYQKGDLTEEKLGATKALLFVHAEYERLWNQMVQGEGFEDIKSE